MMYTAQCSRAGEGGREVRGADGEMEREREERREKWIDQYVEGEREMERERDGEREIEREVWVKHRGKHGGSTFALSDHELTTRATPSSTLNSPSMPAPS
jgi:hypothetical protein